MMLVHTLMRIKGTGKETFAGIEPGVVASSLMAYSRRPLHSPLPQTLNSSSNDYWIPYKTVAGGTYLQSHEQSNQWRVEWGGPQNNLGVGTGTEYAPMVAWWSGYAYSLGTGFTAYWAPDAYTMKSGTSAFDFAYLDKSYLTTPTPEYGYGLGDRSVMTWEMKIDAASQASLPPVSTADHPGIGVFIGDVNTLGTAGTVQISVALTTTQCAVYDCVAGTTLYHATGKDFTKWTTFRLAMGHSEWVGRGSNNVFADFGFGRENDGVAWSNSGLVTLDNTTITPVTYTWLQIGMGLGGATAVGTGNPSGAGNTISLRSIIVSRGQDLSNLNYLNPDRLRGVPATSFSRHVAQGIHCTWGGGGGMQGDSFTMEPLYEYGVDQLGTHSPASHWRSTLTTGQTITFDAQQEETAAEFYHGGVALLGNNSRIVRCDWDDNSAFSSPTGVTIDSTQAVVTVNGAPSKADGFVYTLASGSFRDHELKGFYAEWDDGGGTAKQVFKIRDNVNGFILFDGLTQAFTSYGVGAGDTFYVFADNAMALHNASAGYRYMRLVYPTSVPYEGYHKLGRLVAGSTMSFSVPMDWQHTENQEGNVDLQTLVTGARFAYKAGEPRRTFNGKVIGDVDRTRNLYRAAISKIADYSQKPLVLCLDDGNLNGSMLYSRYIGSTQFANPAWKYDDSTSTWMQVGDMQVTFEEEL
jgi:hypothetical protein